MEIENDEKFIKVVEQLIDPAEVCDLYFFQRFKNFLPRSFFKKMLIKTSRKTPYMGFVIEPYSLFLFYKLIDLEKAKSMLPDRYVLKKSKIFEDEEPDYYFGMGIFNTRASTFWGTRLECYLIAEDTETGLISWIFIDIISDTLIALPKAGVADRNCKNAVYTTSSKGDIYLDIQEDRSGRKIKLKGNLGRAKLRDLYQPIWIDGNTSIAHSKELQDKEDDPFAVIFDPAEVKNGMDIPLEDMDLQEFNLFPELTDGKLCKALCFPFAQHYIADAPGCRTYIKNLDDMVTNYNKVSKLKNIKTFSTKNIKRLFFINIGVTILMSIAFLVLITLRL